MRLSINSAAMILKEEGWSPLSPVAECYTKGKSPVVLRLVTDAGLPEEGESEESSDYTKVVLTDLEGQQIGSHEFELSESGLREAIAAADHVRLTLDE